MPKDTVEDDARVVDAGDAARSIGLFHVDGDMPGLGRRGCGKGFTYLDADGATIRDRALRKRLEGLAIPPAWREVWICPDPRGHIQATGRDAKGRKQYIYHPDFRALRESAKYDHMLEFADALPGIRARVDADMRKRGLGFDKVAATIVHLLEHSLIRVGNARYARTNRSHGLTTLRERHVDLTGSRIRFRFTGKSGKEWDLRLTDRRVARVIRNLQDIPGQHLFQYLDDDGQRRPITSGEVNDYLREISGRDVSAKDFRTWTGTVLAALALAECERDDTRTGCDRTLREVIESVAARLGNTPAICRKCYVHPQIIEAWMADELLLEIRGRIDRDLAGQGLDPDERKVLNFLRRRLKP
ncbi:DNA topoisomerase IB [Paracoccus sp. 1_MG-2023]|uniref:DNA topoisomerase IB n=1 Tax=unclassified Paracoccus (in: a-proteobacteria) TaxID=2688777 RepID=UPI001C09FB43|nr:MULTISPECIES: DNA topoisomerase IB [unclassified Paracoccus (in: a-proteobacteria)]MBU2956167.1 DNA topoisomerase IB [Paracoccus sp. C2R09]MDO6667843.1 DNA topoisomerase IB [Paracoccus sp. 1_MG-2023]